MLGILVLLEFGLLVIMELLFNGLICNFWNRGYFVGGLSGGVVVVVVVGMVFLVYVIDGGGLICILVLCCGVFGLKLSWDWNFVVCKGVRVVDILVGYCVSCFVRDSVMFLFLIEVKGCVVCFDLVGFVIEFDMRCLCIVVLVRNIF